MRVLVTGAGGFAGSHLVDALLADSENEVWGSLQNNERPHYLNQDLRCVVADLCKFDEVKQLLDEAKPEHIYHLAGQAFVPKSWADPWETLETNIRAELNILHGCVQQRLLETRVLVVGSQEEYGRLRPEELPANESSPFRPDSPYGVSKIAQEYLGASYVRSHNLPVLCVRPFNHIGPRQSRKFVAADFAHQIAAIERGDQPPGIRVGNLNAERDFTDVRDIAQAYMAVVSKGAPGESYVVASGMPHSIQSILDGLLALTDRSIKIETDPTRLRPSDTPRQQGDASKLKQATGWAPKIPFEQTLNDILNYERQNYSI